MFQYCQYRRLGVLLTPMESYDYWFITKELPDHHFEYYFIPVDSDRGDQLHTAYNRYNFSSNYHIVYLTIDEVVLNFFIDAHELEGNVHMVPGTAIDF